MIDLPALIRPEIGSPAALMVSANFGRATSQEGIAVSIVSAGFKTSRHGLTSFRVCTMAGTSSPWQPLLASADTRADDLSDVRYEYEKLIRHPAQASAASVPRADGLLGDASSIEIVTTLGGDRCIIGDF